MKTHNIATAPNGEPRTVETLYSAGIWAVHEHEEFVLREYGIKRHVEYPVTHTPTGTRAPWVPGTKEDAIALADALHAAYPSFGADAAWATPPSVSDTVKRGIQQVCILAMSPRARCSWGA